MVLKIGESMSPLADRGKIVRPQVSSVGLVRKVLKGVGSPG